MNLIAVCVLDSESHEDLATFLRLNSVDFLKVIAEDFLILSVVGVYVPPLVLAGVLFPLRIVLAVVENVYAFQFVIETSVLWPAHILFVLTAVFVAVRARWGRD